MPWLLYAFTFWTVLGTLPHSVSNQHIVSPPWHQWSTFSMSMKPRSKPKWWKVPIPPDTTDFKSVTYYQYFFSITMFILQIWLHHVSHLALVQVPTICSILTLRLSIGDCSLLFVCLMSHGRRGTLVDSRSSEIPINDILNQLSNTIPQHLPLVRF